MPGDANHHRSCVSAHLEKSIPPTVTLHHVQPGREFAVPNWDSDLRGSLNSTPRASGFDASAIVLTIGKRESKFRDSCRRRELGQEEKSLC